MRRAGLRIQPVRSRFGGDMPTSPPPLEELQDVTSRALWLPLAFGYGGAMGLLSDRLSIPGG